MKCEIINPSDLCYMSGENREALVLACIVLGNGQYGLKDEKDQEVCPLMLFGGGPEWFKKTFGHDITLDGMESAVADVLDTFEYPRERSSMNNIGARAARISKQLREKSKEPFPKAPVQVFHKD